MAGPLWLRIVFATVMLAVAGYGFCRVLSASRRQNGGLTHLVMGLSMTGMLIGSLDPFPAEFWLAVFAGATAWFGWETVRPALTRTSTVELSPHPSAHFVESIAMIYMLTAIPADTAMSAHMNMPSGTASRFPALAFGLALAVFAHASWTAVRLTPLVPDQDVRLPRLPEYCEIAMGLVMAYLLLLML